MTTWRGLDGITLSEIIQTEKDKYHTISLTRGIEKTNKQTKKKRRHKKQNQTNKYREQTDGCQRGEGWRRGQNG